MLKHIYTTLLFTLTINTNAQPGALDLSFNIGMGADSSILATAVQADGKIVVGGEFNTFNGQAKQFLVRLNTDGSLDNTFNIGTGPNRKVYKIVVLPDGKLLVGGDITFFNGDSIDRLVRLLPDGTTDTTFKADKIESRVKEVVCQLDGKILIGGSFTGVNELPYANFARLHSNGRLDTTFNTQNALTGTVETIAVQPDSKVIVGGSFTSYFGVQGYRIARVNTDGSVDTTFNPGLGGAGSNVDAIELLPNGRLLLGGQFTFYNGSTVGHVVRTNTDGTIDFTFDQTPGANKPVYAVKASPNGNYLLGGEFSTYQGSPAPGIASVKPDGVLDTLFNVGTGPNDQILSLDIDQQNKIIISGDFTTYNDISRNRIARLYNCLTPTPGSINGSALVNCPNTTVTYSIAPVQGAEFYEWTLPNGWTGNSSSTSITTVSNGSAGTISVRAFTSSCGYSFPQILAVSNSKLPAPAICLVTVDTASTHNIVIWEKQPTNLIDSFCIYRETSSNVYTKIASVPYDSLSEYHDYAANPNVTSYRYKLSTIDSCGVESDLSLYHSTIHLQNLSNGNFQWTFYQIEGQLNPILSFNFYRDAINNNNFFPIGNIPGTNSTYTDLTYNSFPDANYVVDANWSIACTPSRAAINTTRSNIKKDKTSIFIGIDEIVLKDDMLVYPNPANGWLNITTQSSQLTAVTLVNALGQTVWFEKENKSTFQVNTQSLPKGVYAVIAETVKGKVTIRIVLN